MTHAFYANMGGFILIDGSRWCHDCRNLIMTQRLDPVAGMGCDYDPCNHSRSHATPVSTLNPSPAQYRKLFKPYSSHHKGWMSNETVYCGQDTATWKGQLPIAVRAIDLCAILTRGVIERLPAITEDHIKGQSKEDVLVKVLTLLQVLWLFAQLIARKVQGLPSTQFEIATLGYAICTFITYLFWLLKPKDLVLTAEVIAVRRLDDYDKSKLIHISGNGFFKNSWQMEFFHNISTYVPNDLYNREATFGTLDTGATGSFDFGSEGVGFVLGAMVFGSTHLIAWNFQFPSEVEHVLWIVASLVIVGIIPLWYVILVFLMLCGRSMDAVAVTKLRRVMQVCGIMVYLIYGQGRVFILAEIFRALFFLPPDAFKATWAAKLPYFS